MWMRIRMRRFRFWGMKYLVAPSLIIFGLPVLICSYLLDLNLSKQRALRQFLLSFAVIGIVLLITTTPLILAGFMSLATAIPIWITAGILIYSFLSARAAVLGLEKWDKAKRKLDNVNSWEQALTQDVESTRKRKEEKQEVAPSTSTSDPGLARNRRRVVPIFTPNPRSPNTSFVRPLTPTSINGNASSLTGTSSSSLSKDSN